MPTVYKIWTEEGFGQLHAVDQKKLVTALDKGWRFIGCPVSKLWKPLKLYIHQPLKKKADIWSTLGALIFEPTAADVLQLCLDQAGEQFKLPFERRKLTVLNITYVIDCLNKKKSSHTPGLERDIKKYAFHKDRLGYSLFKIPQNTSEIFTVEGLASPEDEFKPLVEMHGLKGIHFEKVWTSR